ncbi:MAG: glycosyltransferase, partial [Christensenellaceae bacterium]
ELGIIVSLDNNYSQTTHFFENLLTCVNSDDCQIIVVLDCVTDSTVLHYLESLKNRVDIIIQNNDEKLGYSKANNIGAKLSDNEFLLFINSDVYPKQDAISLLLDYIRSTNVKSIAQGVLLYPQSDLIQSTGHVFGHYFNRHALTNRPISILGNVDIIPRQALTSAFYIMRRALFMQLGGFDEFYYNCWDGLELSLKATDSACSCVCYTKSIAYHATGGSRNYIPHDESQASAYFWSNWGKKITPDLDKLLLREKNKLQDDYFFCINASTIRNFLPYIESLSVNISSSMHLDGRYQSTINLYNELPYYFFREPTSLLFFTDNFQKLKGNRNWFSVRNNKKDVIIDMHGNVLLVQELL